MDDFLGMVMCVNMNKMFLFSKIQKRKEKLGAKYTLKDVYLQVSAV